MSTSFVELRQRYDDFLRVEQHELTEEIASTIDTYSKLENQVVPRLRIPLATLRSFDPQLARLFLRDAFAHIRALEAAVHNIAEEERPGYGVKMGLNEGVTMKVSLTGSVGALPDSPRSLNSQHLSSFVCVEGVTTKVSSVRPKVVKSVHYCASTSKFVERRYRDATDEYLNLPDIDNDGREMPDKILGITTSVYPTKDENGNPLATEYGLSEYKDYQVITLQEMPERAPHGQLPRSIDLILNNDLVDKVKAGDRVQVNGVFRALSPGSGVSTTSGMFRTVMLVNHIQTLGRDSSSLTYHSDDIRDIHTLSDRKDILSILGRSLAPGIYGHEVIKKALILQLLGGCERVLSTGTKLRGDVNILLVGDPSTAKSQLLRAIMKLAPLAISTTGKGSSGVGLTAAVTTDPDTKERRLEAGAMVLADRGIVTIDEFDKMSEADRVAIHEAMEQQTITIAKAGIYASLNARCSVLAAANPVYGQYDKERRVQENIGLPDSLLSRFDLLFVVLDQLDPEHDTSIASHVLSGHRYRRPGTGMAPDLPQHLISDDLDSDDEDDEEDSGQSQGQVWVKPHHSVVGENSGENDTEKILHQDFLRKYLHFAKTRVNPILSEGAREAIASRYAEMRSRQDERTLPITARSLETIIRLASAHAKLRLSNVVEADPDCTAAMDILGFALYHETQEDMTITNLTANRVESDMSDSEESQSSPNKRARVASGGGSKLSVKERIEAALKGFNDDDEIKLDDICKDIDYDEKLEAVRTMEHVMEDDGVLYMV